MRVHTLAGKIDNLSNWDIPTSALYLLAAPSTPDKAIAEAAVRVGAGNGLSIAEVKTIIVNSRRHSPFGFRIRMAREILSAIRECLPLTPADAVDPILVARFAEL